jgi:putative addiction module killer protein
VPSSYQRNARQRKRNRRRSRFNIGNKNVTIYKTVELRGYIDEKGNQPFARWFSDLDYNAAARITTALTRIERGNLSNVKGVGGGVFEYKVDFGPGYRIYFGKDGGQLVILVGGGSKETPGQGYSDGA